MYKKLYWTFNITFPRIIAIIEILIIKMGSLLFLIPNSSLQILLFLIPNSSFRMLERIIM